MKKRILLSVTFTILGIVAIVYALAGQRMHTLNCVSNPDPIFDVFPTGIAKITQIAPPIMKVGTGVKSHSYINVNGPTPVYAPADSLLITGAKYTESFIDPNQIQYTLFLQVSCEVSYYVDHLINPPNHIAELFPGPAKHDTTSDVRFQGVEIKAGELLGYSWSGQFDFGVLNTYKTTTLENFPEYRHSEKAYADCPLNYYDEKTKKVLLGLTGHRNMSDVTVIDNLCD